MNDLFDLNDPCHPFFMPVENGYISKKHTLPNGYTVTIPNGELIYIENYFNEKISDRAVSYFIENDKFDNETYGQESMNEDFLSSANFRNIRWKQDSIKIYGKTIPLPRLTSWYGDSGKSYTYSGITSHPNEWNKGLLYIKNKIEEIAEVEFNSVLLNWYRNGNDHLSWHADDEKELGRNPIIGSANFGVSRDFVIRRKDDHSTKITIPLKHGTVLIMRGELQHYWEHSVPKRKGVKGSRFNLTFRRIGV